MYIFNIYFCAMMANWLHNRTEARVSVLYKHDRKLVGDRTANDKLNEVRITESQFVDDAALYAENGRAFESTETTFTSTASD